MVLNIMGVFDRAISSGSCPLCLVVMDVAGDTEVMQMSVNDILLHFAIAVASELTVKALFCIAAILL